MFQYAYFTGDLSLESVARALANKVIDFLPHKQFYELYVLIRRVLNTAYNAFNGSATWQLVGDVILDIASQIVRLTGYGNIAKVIDILWSGANLV